MQPHIHIPVSGWLAEWPKGTVPLEGRGGGDRAPAVESLERYNRRLAEEEANRFSDTAGGG